MSRVPTPSEDERLVQLLRLKRHESPGDVYFENLLPKIHTKLRAEMMQKSSSKLFFERVGVFFDNTVGGRWFAGGVTAYAAVLLVGFVWLQFGNTGSLQNAQFRPVSYHPNGPVNTATAADSTPQAFNVVPIKPLPPEAAPTVAPEPALKRRSNPANPVPTNP